MFEDVRQLENVDDNVAETAAPARQANGWHPRISPNWLRNLGPHFCENGASSITVTQGSGSIDDLPLESPPLVRFHDLTQVEVFVSASTTSAGYTVEHTPSNEDQVLLRYSGPEANPQASAVGGYER